MRKSSLTVRDAQCQIVSYSDRVIGFQCHMELTPDIVELLIEQSAKDLDRAAEYRFVNTPEELRAHDYSEMNQVLFVFLDKLKHVTNRFNHRMKPGDKHTCGDHRMLPIQAACANCFSKEDTQ